MQVVEAIDDNGNVVYNFGSIQEASKYIGVTYAWDRIKNSTINHVKYKGFYWNIRVKTEE